MNLLRNQHACARDAKGLVLFGWVLFPPKKTGAGQQAGGLLSQFVLSLPPFGGINSAARFPIKRLTLINSKPALLGRRHKNNNLFKIFTK